MPRGKDKIGCKVLSSVFFAAEPRLTLYLQLVLSSDVGSDFFFAFAGVFLLYADLPGSSGKLLFFSDNQRVGLR